MLSLVCRCGLADFFFYVFRSLISRKESTKQLAVILCHRLVHAVHSSCEDMAYTVMMSLNTHL